MKNISKLITRTISGLIYIALIIGAILLGEDALLILSSLFAVIAVIEFTSILSKDGAVNLPVLLLDMAGCISLCFGIFIFPLFFWIFILLIRFIEELYIKENNPIRSLGISMLTQLYIGLPLGLMVALGTFFGNANVLLAIFFFIWINDTGAFVVGSLIGRNRLFERISPKKSWEGFFGGLIFNIIASILFCQFCPEFFGIESSLPLWISLAVIVTIFATWGDLIESLIKRTLHIKDSGNIIPGHGGILDRIDSLLMVMPASFLFFLAIRFLSWG